MKCRTCARRLDLEKLDYTVGCKHEQMEGFICLACAFEGVAYWMTNISEDDYCEEYVPQRTPNAFPTHECVKPTHECVEPVGKSDTLEGKWNVYEVANTEEEQPIAWECSECGEVVEVQYNFCPNCGSRMRGGKDD